MVFLWLSILRINRRDTREFSVPSISYVSRSYVCRSGTRIQVRYDFQKCSSIRSLYISGIWDILDSPRCREMVVTFRLDSCTDMEIMEWKNRTKNFCMVGRNSINRSIISMPCVKKNKRSIVIIAILLFLFYPIIPISS